MKFAKPFFLFLVSALILSSCEVQDEWHVRDTVAGTPSKADTVLANKFVKHEASDSLSALHEEKNLLPEFRK